MRLSFDFTSLEALQDGVKAVIKIESGDRELKQMDYSWVNFENNVLTRSIPQLSIKQSKELDDADRELLKQGSYTAITRFSNEIDSYSNENAMLSKNKRAVLLRTDPYSLMQQPNLLDNTIRVVH